MTIDELMVYLENKFNKKFSYKPVEYDPKEWLQLMELFCEDISIGKLTYPQQFEQDTRFFYGENPNNDFYQDVIKPINVKLPDDYGDDYVNNYVTGYYVAIVEFKLNKINQ